MNPVLKTISGHSVKPLGLAAYEMQSEGIVEAAVTNGINFFFFYSLSFDGFVDELSTVLPEHRNNLVIAAGSEERTEDEMTSTLNAVLDHLHVDTLDVFFTEYVAPADDRTEIFGDHGSIALMKAWQQQGRIRYAGATCHSRELGAELIADGRIDILMHRYNMAHRKAEQFVLPQAERAGVPVVAFTATRWGSLLSGHPQWHDRKPTASDCYRFCLAQPAIQLALTAPTTHKHFHENLTVLDRREMSQAEIEHWRQYGDLVYGDGKDAYETQWL